MQNVIVGHETPLARKAAESIRLGADQWARCSDGDLGADLAAARAAPLRTWLEAWVSEDAQRLANTTPRRATANLILLDLIRPLNRSGSAHNPETPTTPQSARSQR